MALESTQLFHRQSSVTQHLCLTVDSSSLAENVSRSNPATVSPTFSIADILASSFPDTTTTANTTTTTESQLTQTGESRLLAVFPSSPDPSESVVHSK
ncbi:unnamed protein product [Echinostoma caproni]|uniref:Uncharacterized protein n=1 Tax=Echinostoma caproni TaxID=27848 RepID=A0A183B8F5_9TREM|nr:unnamed protein product [Echinostoma caproni]